jgi:phage tail protein X
MAFDQLRPHQSQVLGLIDQGRTLAQIVDILAAQHGVATTPGTLSRFAAASRTTPARPKPVAPPPPNPPAPTELTPAQHARVDDLALKTELLAEIHASRQENRDMLEHLAGKLAGLTADVTELETAITQQGRDLREQIDIALTTASPQRLDPTAAHVAPPSVPAKIILRIWLRALLATALIWAAILALVLLSRGRSGW